MTDAAIAAEIRRMIDTLKWDERGLLPTVVQDSADGAVLMVAWMNAEALRRTLETGEAHFWSRSRGELWHKGATSGNTQRVDAILVDCDADTLLLKVTPAGPSCHTGARSCFYAELDTRPAPPDAGESGSRPEASSEDLAPSAGLPEIIDRLFAVIKSRQENPKASSYTARLFAAGRDEIAKKVGEEAVEVILAAKGQGDARLVSELADLTYHCLVLLADCGLEPGDVAQELRRRYNP